MSTTTPPRPAGAPRDGDEGTAIRSLARGGTFTLGGAVAGAILGFLFVLLAARGLRAQGAGALFEAMAIFMIATTVARLGADTGVVRALPRLRVLGDGHDTATTLLAAVGPVAVVSTAIGLLLFGFADALGGLVARHGDVGAIATYVRVLAPFVPIASIGGVLLASLRGMGRMRPFVLVSFVVIPGLRPLLLLAVLWLRPSVLLVGLAWSLPLVIALLPTLRVLQGAVTRPSRARRRHVAWTAWSTPTGREFWRFTAPRAMATTVQVTMLWLDILLVGALVSVEEAAVYTAANRYVVAGTLALNAASLVIAPQISGLLAARRRREAQELFQTATWWLMAASWPLYLAMAVFAPTLMGAFGPEFERGATALAVLAIAMLVLMGTGNNKVVLLMAGGSGVNLAITVVALVVNVGANLLLVPRYGMEGAALAWAASIAFDNVATTVALRWRVGLAPFGRGYATIAVAALSCFGAGPLAARLLFGSSITVAVLALATVALPYAVVLWWYRERLRLGAFRSVVRRRVDAARPPTLVSEVP